MEKLSPVSASLGLITRIWRRWRNRPPGQNDARADNPASHSKNYAGKWPDANAVLAWRLSATIQAEPGKPGMDAPAGSKQELP
jgi:hypothetical protein